MDPPGGFASYTSYTNQQEAVMRAPLLGGLTIVALLALGSCKDDVGLTSIPPAPERFIAFMSGANEPTPITTPAQGLATVTVNDHVLSYRIELSNIDSAFLAHIHDGRAGTNGGVIVNLYVPPRLATDTGFTGLLVEDSEIEHSVIMEDCRVRGVRRLEDSLLGRGVVVERSEDGKRSYQLMVGDSGRIGLL